MNTFAILFCFSLALVLTNGSRGWKIYGKEQSKDELSNPNGRLIGRGRNTINVKDTTTKTFTELNIETTTENIPHVSGTELPKTTIVDTTEYSTEGHIKRKPKDVTRRPSKKTTTTSTPDEMTYTSSYFEPTNFENDQLPSECLPPVGSVYNKRDLVNIVDFVISNELQVLDKINQSYYNSAVAIRNRHEKNIKSFLEWLESHAQHFKHNLEHIEKIRNNLQPKVDKFKKEMEQYPELLNKYSKTNQTIEKLKKEFEFVKSICKNNCGEQNEKLISESLQNDDYYCSSIKDIFEKVKKDMEDFMNNTTNEMSERLGKDDKKYNEEIKQLQEYLKFLALKEFGRTMYHILNLLDEYHHLKDDVNKYDVSGLLFNVTNEFIKIDLAVSITQHKVKQLKRKCLSCLSGVLRTSGSQKLQVLELKNKTLLEISIQEKQAEILLSVNKVYNEFFYELNKKISIDEEEKQKIIDKLRPIEKEVSEITAEEIKIYNDLAQNITVLTRFDELTTLDLGTQSLSNDVKDLMQEIDKLNNKS